MNKATTDKVQTRLLNGCVCCPAAFAGFKLKPEIYIAAKITLKLSHEDAIIILAWASTIIESIAKAKNIGKDSFKFSVARLDLSNISSCIFDLSIKGRKSWKKYKRRVRRIISIIRFNFYWFVTHYITWEIKNENYDLINLDAVWEAWEHCEYEI